MNEQQYWDILRSVRYLFSTSRVYEAGGSLAQAQQRYYQRKKEAILSRLKERYETDEEFRQKRIARVKVCQARKKAPAGGVMREPLSEFPLLAWG